MPTAPISSARFAEYLAMDARNHGMNLRFSYAPYPLVGRPREVLRRYAEGNDAVTGKPIMPQIVDALTRPLTEDEKNPKAERGAPRPRLMKPDTEESMHQLFLENGWTDGAPIVLPTEDRVARMLTGTAADPNEVVGRMTVTIHQERLEYTVEKVAVNAVMAGAGPEHLPVILALAASEQPSMPSSTTSFARMAVVNGPIREEIGMNSGLGALSPFNHANTVVGRAWTLMSLNFADARPGETFMGSTGSNLNYNNMTFAENEERSVWEPFHVRRGFKKEESTVSVFQGWSAINSMGAAGCVRPAQEEMLIILQAFSGMMGAITLVMDPLVANHLKEQGFDDPSKLAKYLSENFQMTAEQYWGSDVVYSLVEPNARSGVDLFASWLKLPKDAMIKPYHNPDLINVVVVGERPRPSGSPPTCGAQRPCLSTNGVPRKACTRKTNGQLSAGPPAGNVTRLRSAAADTTSEQRRLGGLAPDRRGRSSRGATMRRDIMELKEAVAQRYAAKHFDGRPIPEDKIRELLELVRWAPSGLNIQPWRIRVVADPAVKRELSVATYDEPQIMSCSHLLVFSADADFAGLAARLAARMEQEGVPEMIRTIVEGIAADMSNMPPQAWMAYATANTYLPAFLAQLAAKDLGFDSCLMSHFQADEYSLILGLPKHLTPVLLCPLGYADDRPLPKWRYSVEELLIG